MDAETMSTIKDAATEVLGESGIDQAKEFLNGAEDVLAVPLVKGVLTLVVCLILAKVLLAVTDGVVKRMKLEPTVHKFIRSVFRAAVYAVVILVAAGTLGFEISSLVALVSVCGAALALAAQDALGNFFGGVLLMVTKPFLAGDYISTAEGEGTVLEVGLFYTQLTTIDNRVVVIPNGTISSTTVTNCSTGHIRRIDLNFNVSYEADMDQVERIMIQVMEANAMVLREPEPPFARITAFGTGGVQYTARFWADGSNYWPVQYDMLENIKRALDDAGIQLQYNHLNVHMTQGK